MKTQPLLRDLLLVFIGGGSGATLRALLLEVFPVEGLLPVTVLVINCAGALALGCLTGFLASSTASYWTPDALRSGQLLLGTGLLGGFTTYSTLALALAQLTAAGHWGAALLYASLSLAGGYLCASWGIRVGRRLG